MSDRLKAMWERLRLLREEAGLTQARAAMAANIDASSLSRYERGIVEDPSMQTLSDLARVYGGARLDWIVSGIEPKMAVTEVEGAGAYPEVEAYIARRADLSPDETASLRGFRFSGGGEAVTEELLDGLLMGIRMRNKLRPRPKLTE